MPANWETLEEGDTIPGFCLRRNTNPVIWRVDSDGSRLPLPSIGSSSTFPEDMLGERRTRQLLGALAEPSAGTIVIYGMGGIGKTWIAKQACYMLSSLFDIFIWVPLSSTCSIRCAREKISEKLSILSRDDGGEESSRQKIYEFLDGRKFLLVLDDAWFMDEDDVLSLLGIPSPRQGNGSKIIVTTRTRRALSVMSPDIVFEPDLLTQRESRELFCEKTDKDGIRSNLALTVLYKCDGLPLSIVLIAGALTDAASDSAKEEVLRNMSLALGNCFHTDYTQLDRAVKFGYYMLPNNAVKYCLLYCILFLGDICIMVHDLIQHWYMNDLLDGCQGWEDAYTNGQATVTLLLERGMLYKEEDGFLRMHNVVREVVFNVEERNGLFRRSWVKQVNKAPALCMTFSRKRTREIMSLMDGMMDGKLDWQIPPDFAKYSALLLRGNRFLKVIPSAFLLHVINLEVLDLSFTPIKLLPPSISWLWNLRFLLLRGCESLKELQYICPLKNLKVLDISGATSLRRIDPESFIQMCSLQVLSLSRTPIELLPSIDGLNELRQLFLGGCWCLRDVCFPETLIKLELLDLSYITLVHFPYELLKLPSLKHLNLLGTKLEIAGEVRTCSLESYVPVVLLRDDGRVCVSVSSAKFRSIDKGRLSWENSFQRFYFCVSPMLEENINTDVLFQRKQVVFTESYFKSRQFAHSVEIGRYLEVHCIDNYPDAAKMLLSHSELVSLNDVMFMKRLSDLGLENMKYMRECWIERCNNIESVFVGEEVDRMAAIGSLENLWLSNLENLKFVCGSMERIMSFSCLKHLLVDCCPNLTNLFDSAMNLQQLETLQIKFCDRLESVFKDSVQGNYTLPRLRKLTLWQLPELKSVCGGILPALNSLQVKECPKLKKLPLGVTEASPLVRIKGESSWRNNLVIEDERIRPYLLFRKWGRF